VHREKCYRYVGSILGEGSAGLAMCAIKRDAVGIRTRRELYFQNQVLLNALVLLSKYLRLAGYVQEKEKTKLFLPEGLTSVTLQISPNFNTSDYRPFQWTVKVDPVFGTFNTTLKIPQAAVLQDYEVQAKMPGAPNDYSMLDTVEITVGDPRPPTALLNITVPTWVSIQTTKMHTTTFFLALMLSYNSH
jgi:hypothetical protein